MITLRIKEPRKDMKQLKFEELTAIVTASEMVKARPRAVELYEKYNDMFEYNFGLVIASVYLAGKYDALMGGEEA